MNGSSKCVCVSIPPVGSVVGWMEKVSGGVCDNGWRESSGGVCDNGWRESVEGCVTMDGGSQWRGV